MVKVITMQEWADATGRSLADVEAMVEEAENGLITRDTMDPSTLVTHNITPETEERMRQMLAQAQTKGILA